MASSCLLLSLLLSTATLTLKVPKALAAPPTTAALKGCPTQCGSVTVPYPFGFASGCYHPELQVECNSSSSSPVIRLPVTEQNQGNNLISISNMSLDGLIVQLGVAVDCTSLNLGSHSIFADLGNSPYTLSYTRNKFVVLGCTSIGVIALTKGEVQLGQSCQSTCADRSGITNGLCSTTAGCCQATIPKSLKTYAVVAQRLNDTTNRAISPCSYAFIMDDQQYIFRSTDLSNFLGSRRISTVPVVLEWTIGKYNCSVERTSLDYACGANARCMDSNSSSGYRCSCISGYEGNPYVSDGCQDVNECAEPGMNSCSHICTNTPGSFNCSCPKGSYGDGLKSGKGCIKEVKRFPLLQVILGCGLSFLFFLLSGSWLYHFLKLRKLTRLKEKFFEQNGGLIMQKIILSQHGSTQAAKIFSEKELKKATSNYSSNRILGEGAYGTVYKGVLPDKKFVAIKRSKIENEIQVEQFINEIVILFQLNHRNVVKIIGCCLESQVPLLVYEYIPNGTLFHHIHDPDRFSSLSWQARLRIATEISDGMAYLHSFPLRPIIHRDIKSSNILLDENYCAKVSDFGISMIVPKDGNEKTTKLQGTLGYLDPESFETGQLSQQSDVYSFGVVLAELLTGEMHIFEKADTKIGLANYFVYSMEKNMLFEILEPRVRDEANPDHLLKVSNLVKKCLREKGAGRPSMEEVASELAKLRNEQSQMMYSSRKVQSGGNGCSFSMSGPSTSGNTHPSSGISSEDIEVLNSRNTWYNYMC